MKKIISILLTVILLASMSTVGIVAEDAPADKAWTNPSGNVLKFTDIEFSNRGNMGYAENTWNDENDKPYQKFGKDMPNGEPYSENGITVAFDVMVSEILVDSAGKFSQIALFMNEDQPHSYAAFNFTKEHTRRNKVYDEHMAFECYSGAWPTYDNTLESKYAVHAATPFDWQLGEWYRMAVKFDKNVVSIYLNGEKMTEWDFEFNDHKFILMFPQYLTAYFDNFVTATAAYDVVNENYIDNPEVYDYIDFENAVNENIYSGVVAGDWSFTGGGSVSGLARSGYNLAKYDEIEIAQTVTLKGDANGDNKVIATDAIDIIRVAAKYENTVIDEVNSDVNGDGKVTVADAIEILRYVAQWENKYGIGEEIKTAGKITYLGTK